MQHVDPIYQIPVWQGQLADSKALIATVNTAQQILPEWHAQSVEQRHTTIQSWLTTCQQQLALLSKTFSSTTGLPLRQSKQMLETWCTYKPNSITVDIASKGSSILIINTVDFQPWQVLLKLLAQGNAVVVIITPTLAAFWELLQQYWKQSSSLPALQGLIMDQLVQEGWQTLPIDSLLYFGNRALAMQLHQQLTGRFNLPAEFIVPVLQTAVITEAPSTHDSLDMIIHWAYEASGQKLGALKRLILLDTVANKTWLQRLLAAIKVLRVAAYDATPDPVISSMASAKLAEQTLETYPASVFQYLP